MNEYSEMKRRNQNEVNGFPMAFAFNDTQFEEGMRKLGLEPSETDKACSVGSTGGFCKKIDVPALHKMFKRHREELETCIREDTTGDGFIFQMFKAELNNTEYVITGSVAEALEALGLTLDEVNNNMCLLHGLNKACTLLKKQME